MKLPKKFYKMTKEEQIDYAVNKMNEHYFMYEAWKRVSVNARKKHIPEPEIDRPDLMNLKDPVN